ncbi:MAG: hypothetical protein ACLQG3_14420 [Terracidiphilus sp.]
MTRKSAKPKDEKPQTAKTPRKKRGRKPSRKPTPAEPTPPGQGATRLRDSVNTLVSRESDRIAQALIDKTVAGNMSSARILIELAGKPPLQEEDTGPSMADLLTAEPEWYPGIEEDYPEYFRLLANYRPGDPLPIFDPDKYKPKPKLLPAPKPDGDDGYPTTDH